MNMETVYGNSMAIAQLFSLCDEPFLILRGPEGLGKSIAAKELARIQLCFTKGVDCRCESCSRFKKGTHTDFNYYALAEDSNTIKVKEIESIFNEMVSEPLISGNKVFLINDANCLTQESQNKLLKTLEESPEYAKIIFVSHGELLKTVISRAKTIEFTQLPPMEMQKYIKTLTDDVSKQEILCACSDGCPGMAYTLNQGSFVLYMKKIIDMLLCDNFTAVDILDHTGLLKEKDTKCITDRFSEEMAGFLNGLRALWLDSLRMQCNAKSIVFNSLKDHIKIPVTTARYNISLTDRCLQDHAQGKLSKERIIQILNK